MIRTGDDLGGVRTVERLRDRCVVDEDTKCWHWSLGKDNGQARVWLVHPVTQEQKRMPGTRAAWILTHGRDVPAGKIAWLRCHSRDCVNPAHVRCTTKAERGKFIAARGDLKGVVARTAANTAIARRNAKLSIEAAREIRASDRPAKEQAMRYGVAEATIRSVRAGKAWKASTTPTASVFAWAEAMA